MSHDVRSQDAVRVSHKTGGTLASFPPSLRDTDVEVDPEQMGRYAELQGMSLFLTVGILPKIQNKIK